MPRFSVSARLRATLSILSVLGAVAVGLPATASAATSATISGVVHGPADALLEGVNVFVLPTDPSNPTNYSDTTDAAGAYSIADVPFGSYRVLFLSNSDTIASEYWEGEPQFDSRGADILTFD